jgi:hypothetical protein
LWHWDRLRVVLALHPPRICCKVLSDPKFL